jgi:hypothetical protein
MISRLSVDPSHLLKELCIFMATYDMVSLMERKSEAGSGPVQGSNPVLKRYTS